VPAPPAAPLSPEFAERPLWHDDVTLPTVPPPGLRPHADVVVIGAGYCGLSAAAELASRGRSVVVLEADALGTGASTRNGGMVIPELKLGPRALAKRYGPLGGELVDSVLDAYDLVERLVDEHRIDCDLERTGGLLLAHHRAHVASLREAADEWSEDLGQDARFVARGELASEIGSTEYEAGFVLEKTAGLQPAKYHAGLLRRALSAGAAVHERMPATGLESRVGGGWRVRTADASVDADEVLLATNAYADGLVPALARRVLPIGSYIIATEPLDPALAAELIPRRRMVFDTKQFLFYWRLSPDGRMVFGGRTGLGSTTLARSRDELHAAMTRVHPQLQGTRVARSWGGNVAITLDRMPHCGRIGVPGGGTVAYATGCNGTGVALATWFGARAASWLSGEAPPPAFAQLPFRPIPLHALRELYLPAVGWVLRGMDRFGR
jgi:glycine/D-amino acid oxidase-like deaminating enzyme